MSQDTKKVEIKNFNNMRNINKTTTIL